MSEVKPRIDRTVRGDFLGETGAHVGWVRHDAYTSEIKAVGIPAGGDGGIIVVFPIRVPCAGFVQEFEVIVGQVEMNAAKLPREVRSTTAVVRIMVFIFPTAVVKECEELDDRNDGSGSCGQD